MSEVVGRAEEKTPYVIVALQECERMNTLIIELRRSLKELDLGLKVEINLCLSNDGVSQSLFTDFEQIIVNRSQI